MFANVCVLWRAYVRACVRSAVEPQHSLVDGHDKEAWKSKRQQTEADRRRERRVQGLVLVGAALGAAHVALEQGALSPLSPAATRKTRAKLFATALWRPLLCDAPPGSCADACVAACRMPHAPGARASNASGECSPPAS